MALSRVIKTGDGSTTQFVVDFALGYLDPADVTARVGDEVDGTGSPIYRTITFLSDSLMQISGAPAGVGVRVVFERTVEKEDAIVHFSAGDVMDEINLDLSFKQILMAVHEVLDGRIPSFNIDLSMGNFRITELGDPIDNTDGVNKQYMDTRIATNVAQMAASAASASEAAASALQANNHRLATAVSETNARASQNASATSAAASSGSAGQAANSETNAAASKVAAAASAATATEQRALAQQARSGSEVARDTAIAARDTAIAARDAAIAARNLADGYHNSASASAIAAAASATTASTKAAEALASATAAATFDPSSYYSKGEVEDRIQAGGVPIGASIMWNSGTNVPDGFLKENGAAISRTVYPELFAVIGTMYGAGNGSTTFNVPDSRAEFIRGLDDGRGVDVGRVLGSWQDSQNRSHAHTGTAVEAGWHAHTGSTSASGDHAHTFPLSSNDGVGSYVDRSDGAAPGIGTTNAAGNHAHSLFINADGAHIHSLYIVASGGTEARPRNVAKLVLIRAY